MRRYMFSNVVVKSVSSCGVYCVPCSLWLYTHTHTHNFILVRPLPCTAVTRTELHITIDAQYKLHKHHIWTRNRVWKWYIFGRSMVFIRQKSRRLLIHSTNKILVTLYLPNEPSCRAWRSITLVQYATPYCKLLSAGY